MTTPVVFSVGEFFGAFPELSSLPPLRVSMAFTASTTIVDNSEDPDIVDDNQRKEILYLLTAHICLLMAQAVTVTQGDPSCGGAGTTISTGMTGRLSSATEGSVSIATEAISSGNASALEKWMESTQYGALAWMMLRPLFTAFYIPGPDRSGMFLP